MTILGMDFSGETVMQRLSGNKTYLIVIVLILINTFMGREIYGMDEMVVTLKEDLEILLVGTIRAGIAKVGVS